MEQSWLNYHARDPEDAPARTFSHRLLSLFSRYVLVQRIETRSEQFVKFKNSLISPTYDQNKFLKVFLKEKSLIFGQLRPAPKRQKKRNLQFFLRDRLEFNPISPTVATKTENSNQNCENISPQSRKIRKNRIFHNTFSLFFLPNFDVFRWEIAR